MMVHNENVFDHGVAVPCHSNAIVPCFLKPSRDQIHEKQTFSNHELRKLDVNNYV
jgi:hypothetical protein